MNKGQQLENFTANNKFINSQLAKHAQIGPIFEYFVIEYSNTNVFVAITNI